MAVSDDTGTVTDKASYDAWGNSYGQLGSRVLYGYTGREPDGTGLIYYRARYYDPSVGRFTQRDPKGFIDGINRYAYAVNSPVNYVDPMGTSIFNSALTNTNAAQQSYHSGAGSLGWDGSAGFDSAYQGMPAGSGGGSGVSSNLATSYEDSNGEGWVDKWGNMYPPNLDFNNSEVGLEGVYPEALLPIYRTGQGVAVLGEALALKTTQHGAVRIGANAARGGTASRLTLFQLRIFGQSTTAANGTRIYYQVTSSGRYNFSAYGKGGFVTSGQGWNARRTISMAKRYGWEGF